MGTSQPRIPCGQPAGHVTTPDGKTVDTGFFSRPSSILISGAFKIKGGLIQQVEAVGASVPYHMYPGWEEK